jgi:ferredoxin
MELLPELIRSDDWGYPIAIDGHPELKVPGALIDYARRAVKECPRLALTLLPDGA